MTARGGGGGGGGPNRSLTAVPGLQVGHAHDSEAATGCTVVLGPFRGAVELHGLATGSRELDALSPLHLVPGCDAVLLTGGSAFGLASADGVVSWLEEHGRGFPTRAARVPIVPAAVVYDLGTGRADVRPGPAMGRAAAEAASAAPVAEGRVGVGAGATVGKILGPDGAEPGGLGSWAEGPGPEAAGGADGVTVAALAVVNAFGDVVDAAGRVLAGCRTEEGGYLDTAGAIREGRVPLRFPYAGARAAESTTLAVVATDAPLSKPDLQLVARTAAGAFPRRLSPSGTPFDGDLVFALSTGSPERAGEDWPWARTPHEEGTRTEPLEVLSLGLRARGALERAIERAVSPAARGEEGAGDAPAAGDAPRGRRKGAEP